jgi:hypothetical protein
LLLFFNPAHNLLGIEEQFAAGPGAEVRKPARDPRIPDAPGRAANEKGDLANIERRAEP